MNPRDIANLCEGGQPRGMTWIKDQIGDRVITAATWDRDLHQAMWAALIEREDG